MGRRRAAWVALALAAATLGARPATARPACAAPSGFDVGGRLEAADLVVLYRTLPGPIEVGRYFAVEALVCAAGPARVVAVDADMPEHRHGMNYRAQVTAAGPGRYVARGLLFHMPGRWRLQIDVERGGRTERLATDIVLE